MLANWIRSQIIGYILRPWNHIFQQWCLNVRANAETGIGYDKREGNKKAGETPCGFFATTARLKSFDLINGFLIGAGYITKLCVRCLVIINNNIQHYTIDSVYLKIQAL